MGKRGMCSRATQYLPTRAAVARHEWEHEFVRKYERDPDKEESDAAYETIVGRLHNDSPGSFDDTIDYTCTEYGCGFGTIDPNTFKRTPVSDKMGLDALATLIAKAVN